MRAIALFSGGKDSTYSIYLAMQQGFEIEKLVTIFPKRDDSYMYHVPMIERTRIQSEAMGIPQDIYRIGDSIEELHSVLSNYDVDAVVSGAIASNYQKTRIEEVCTDLGLLSFAPLWGKNQEILLRDMIEAGLKIMVIGVYAYGLEKKHLGRVIDESFINELKDLEKKYRINLAGEGGEYESFVLDAPHFQRKIVVDDAEKFWDGLRGELRIKRLHLEDREK